MVQVGADNVLAAEIRIAKDDGNVTVSKGEKVRNLYVGGNLVSINADVEKGLYVGVNVVAVRENVEDNYVVIIFS